MIKTLKNKLKSLTKSKSQKEVDLLQLVDGAYDLVELYIPEGEYNKKWKENWLKKAKELGASSSM